MKSRIAAFLLIAVMLFGALSMSVNADMPTLQSYITSVANTAGNVIISLPGDTVVSSATVIPLNVTVYVGPSVKLFVNASLTVYGTLRAALSTNIIVGPGGSVTTENTSPNPPANYWTQYNPSYPWTINPPQGPYCYICKTNTKIWCFTCLTYHCVNCTPHYSQNPSNYCVFHHINKYYCAKCGGYYCQSCDNGTHAYNTSLGRCITVPFTNSITCSAHGISRLYCPNCNIYYCQACIGGVHVNINGICSIYNGITSGFCPLHSVSKLYCSYCKQYYCPSCINGYHVQSMTDPTKCVVSATGFNYYCTVHGISKSYCAKCNLYYCPTCLGGYHYYINSTSPCVIYYNGGSSTIPGYNPYFSLYYYYDYVFIPGYGYVAINVACAAPTSSIASGTVVEEGTKITLSTTTPGASIYYTTNGSVPTASSAKYTEPIAVTRDVTIYAIALHPSIFNSPVVNFTYKIKVPVSNSIYNDLSGYPKLAASLDILLAKKIITAASTFNPSGKVSWDDVYSWFVKLGVKVSDANIDPGTAFKDSDSLTYEEMIFACYKIMRSAKIIPAPRKQGTDTIELLKYSSEITDKAVYKAAYASFIENKVLYGLDFKPQGTANRAYLAAAVAWAASKIK